MSEHVITIGSDQAKRIARDYRLKLRDREHQLSVLKFGFEIGRVKDYSNYWQSRISELEHETKELRALSNLFDGATTVTITRGDNNDNQETQRRTEHR